MIRVTPLLCLITAMENIVVDGIATVAEMAGVVIVGIADRAPMINVSVVNPSPLNAPVVIQVNL